MGTKTGTSYGRPTGDQTAVEIFAEALPKSAPHGLVKLRETPPGNPSALAQWARNHYLDSPVLIRSAIGVRRQWEERPDNANRLVVIRWATLDAVVRPVESEVVTTPYDQWVDDNVGYPSTAPVPHLETLEQWLLRAKNLYNERAALMPELKTRYRRWDDFRRHCRWFVDLQVNGKTASELSRKAGIDHRAIGRAADNIAALLELPRRSG